MVRATCQPVFLMVCAMAKTVVVGMSGGVDSSLCAMLLKEQGYDVIGLFMRNWHEEGDDGICTAEQDFQDVKDVASKLDIPYFSVDFSKEYMDRVFLQFVEEYKKGRTPNPDVLCNKEIKFDMFLDHAKKAGADYIATGHYCDISHDDGRHWLLEAVDQNKDQTYFLNQLNEKQLENVMFPLGKMPKEEVRRLAKQYGLSTAEKKDSTGICFIGERNFRQFLSEYIPMKQGDIVNKDGEVVGNHQGVFYYTLGQRKGLGIGGKNGATDKPWYVIDKDVEKNILYVSQGEGEELFSDWLETDNFNFITERPKTDEFACEVRIRHRQPKQKATGKILPTGSVRLEFEKPQRAVCAGQYAVIYMDNKCYGGGVIELKGKK